VIIFADGHTRQLPKITNNTGPFHYSAYADSYVLKKAKQLTLNARCKAGSDCGSASSAISHYIRRKELRDILNEQFIK